MNFDVLVIGGGVNGLATAYHLSQHKGLKIGLVEQFSLGHAQGSSHGFSRIFRSTYTNPAYTRLAKRARRDEWSALEKDSGSRLIHPHPRCAFGVASAFDAWVKAIVANDSNSDIELLDVSAARRLFPQFRFPHSQRVLHDRSSGVIAAQDTMKSLAKIIVRNNVAIFENTKVLKILSASDSLRLETTRGVLTSQRLVITAGPWMQQFVSVCPIRQIVGYFELPGAEAFPNWVYHGENSCFYGFPAFGCEGIKISQDIIAGEADDPDERTPNIDPAKVKALEDFVREQFVAPMQRLVRVETCFYTNTATTDFVLDLMPQDPRIAIGSACSGHAFKFAPLTGRILAELVLHGKTLVPEFEENRELFSVKALFTPKLCV